MSTQRIGSALATLVAGMLFGFGLSLATMIQPQVVLSFLRFPDFGLMLVMGVPSDEPWRQWTDPAADWPAWNERLVAGFVFDVEHNDLWSVDWGPKPATLSDQADVVRSLINEAPGLFPIYGNYVVPLTAADGVPNSDGNPVLLVDGSNVTLIGDDLAAWMHHQFDVPLPMWPAEQRTFPFWSTSAN